VLRQEDLEFKASPWLYNQALSHKEKKGRKKKRKEGRKEEKKSEI
jgi:hypothetical protein